MLKLVVALKSGLRFRTIVEMGALVVRGGFLEMGEIRESGVRMTEREKRARTYFDFNATTPYHPELIQKVPEWLNSWGNPSSIHWASRQPKVLLRESRLDLAKMIGANPLEIIFTSGGSESNNTVIKSMVSLLKDRPHIMCSSVEHPSVMRTFEFLQSKGAKWDLIPVNRDGNLDLDFYKNNLSEKTAFVSVMLANNETGHIFPIGKLAKMARARGTLFHTDAVQGFGKIPVDVVRMGVDFASFSGHKFYSLKGSGFIYARKGQVLQPLVHGGGQERHRRGGTENTLGIAALGYMAKTFSGEIESQGNRLRKIRDHFEAQVQQLIPEVSVTGQSGDRLPNTSSLVLPGVDGETLLMSLDIKGYAVSTGAACSSGNPEPSPVLLAMGLSRAEAQNSLRVSFGWFTTEAEVECFVDVLKETVAYLRQVSQDSVARNEVFCGI